MSSYITFYYCYWKYIFIQECQECRHPHLRPYLPTFLPLKFGHQKDHHLHRQVGKLANFARGEQELVGHMRIELSFLLCKYLARDGCCLEFMPTGPRYLKDGLVVPGCFKALSNEKALISILKNKLGKKDNKLKHLKLTVNKLSLNTVIRYFHVSWF